MRKLRIVSDGTGWGTQVLVIGDDGSETPVPDVVALEVSVEAGGIVTASLVVRCALDVIADEAAPEGGGNG